NHKALFNRDSQPEEFTNVDCIGKNSAASRDYTAASNAMEQTKRPLRLIGDFIMWTPFRRSTIRTASEKTESGRVLLESLEYRKLLSGAASVVVQPELTLTAAATTT